MQRRNGSDKKEDGIDLLFLKLFEEGISDFEIFEVLTKINRSIQELNDEVEIPDSFQEFDILDKLLQFFDEKEDETLRKAILTLLQTVIKRNLTEEDEIETIRRIINFCLANIPNETEVDFILSILNSIAVKKERNARFAH
jgi:tRNA C32,U32 (ribose-2'-O)-methylase TrmJ